MDNGTYCCDFRDRLGKGSYGSVFKGNKKENESYFVAIKEIENDERYDGPLSQSANKEFSTLKKVCGHRNIVELLAFYTTPRFFYIIMEYCELGDLQNYLQKKTLKFREKFEIIKECAEGVHYLHSLSPPVIHRDLKPGNILMTKTPDGDTAKIADFGLAKIFDSEDEIFMSTDTGTSMFRAPELFVKGRKQYTAAVDTFSLGLVYVVLCNYDGKSVKTFEPYNPKGPYILYGQKLLFCAEDKTPMPSILEFTSGDSEAEIMTKALIMKMIQLDWQKRINMKDVLADIDIIQSDRRPVSCTYHQRVIREKDDSISRLKDECENLNIIHEQKLVSINDKFSRFVRGMWWIEECERSRCERQSLEETSLCGPVRVAQQYETLCYNSWQEAKNFFSEELKFKEKEVCLFLNDILMLSCKEASKMFDAALQLIQHNILHRDPVQVITELLEQTLKMENYEAIVSQTDKIQLPDVLIIYIGKSFRRTVGEHDLSYLVKLTRAAIEKDYKSVRKYLKAKPVEIYIQEACTLGWKMAIQHPPMTYSEEDQAKKWKDTMYKTHVPYRGSDPTKPNATIQYYVHPIMKHGSKVLVNGRVYVNG